MAVFSKVLTMLRGNLREIGQSIVDGNASTIYEQEIVEASAHVATAKHDLTAVMAKEMQAGREIERLRAELQKYEELAVQALQRMRPAWPKKSPRAWRTWKWRWPNRKRHVPSTPPTWRA